MACLKVRDIKKALIKKGFQLDTKQGNTDHDYYRLFNEVGEKLPITTKLSHGETEIYDPLIAEMSYQLGLNKRKFMDYVSCTLSYKKYLKIYKTPVR